MNRRGLIAAVDSLWAPCLVLALVYPFLTPLENLLFRYTEISFGSQLTYIFIYAILALGLNVVVGYTGLLHLGIAAFFGIGAYITGILRVAAYPFQLDFCSTLVLSAFGAGVVGSFSRRTDTTAARRLPGDRDPRLRRGDPVHASQPGIDYRRHARLESDSPAGDSRPIGLAVGRVGIVPDFALDYRLFYY